MWNFMNLRKGSCMFVGEGFNPPSSGRVRMGVLKSPLERGFRGVSLRSIRRWIPDQAGKNKKSACFFSETNQIYGTGQRVKNLQSH